METRSRKKKRDMERSAFSELPDDLLVEIISRLPFKSTRRCKCVCRRWHDVLSHPDHRKKLPWSTLAGFFYEAGKLLGRRMTRRYKSLSTNWCHGIDPSLSFLPKYMHCGIHIDMVDCCNGLLLCRLQKTDHYRATDYVVCNPATKRWVAVPATDQSREVWRIARLGFDPVVSSHFHVFEFAWADTSHIKSSLEIYSSRTGVWTHPSDWDCPIDIENYWGSTFFRGELYLASYDDKVVAAVDMEGNCRVIRLPPSHGSCYARYICVSSGQLHWVVSSDSELSIWALDDFGTENWTLKHTVNLLQLFGAEDSSHVPYYNVIVHPEYKVIFILYKGFCSRRLSWMKVMSYDMDSRELHSIIELGFDCKGPYLSYVPLFSPSLADGH